MIRIFKRFVRLSSSWSWGAIVANLLTFLTLWFSIHQNNINEKDSTKELKRIRTRDSVESYRDSIRTQILINELSVQTKENKRNRIKDSSQLSLFSSQISLLNKSLIAQNRGIEIQNKSLEVERLGKRSQLVLKVNLKVGRYNNGYINPLLSYSLTNVGNSIAQDIITQYCIVSIDNTNNQITSCINSSDAAHDNTIIKPNELAVIAPFDSQGFPVTKKSNYNEIRSIKYEEIRKRHITEMDNAKSSDERSKVFSKQRLDDENFNKKYPKESFTNFMIVKVSYRDKYQNEPNEVYAVISINYNTDFNLEQMQIYPLNAHYSDLEKLRKCIKQNKFDVKKITEQLKQSTSKNENSITN